MLSANILLRTFNAAAESHNLHIEQDFVQSALAHCFIQDFHMLGKALVCALSPEDRISGCLAAAAASKCRRRGRGQGRIGAQNR